MMEDRLKTCPTCGEMIYLKYAGNIFCKCQRDQMFPADDILWKRHREMQETSNKQLAEIRKLREYIQIVAEDGDYFRAEELEQELQLRK